MYILEAWTCGRSSPCSWLLKPPCCRANITQLCCVATVRVKLRGKDPREKYRLGGAAPAGCRYKRTLATGPHCDGWTFKEEALLWSMRGGIWLSIKVCEALAKSEAWTDSRIQFRWIGTDWHFTSCEYPSWDSLWRLYWTKCWHCSQAIRDKCIREFPTTLLLFCSVVLVWPSEF